MELVELGIEGFKDIILIIIGEEVKSFYIDLSFWIGEWVMVFKLFNDLEKNLEKIL